MVPIPVHVNRQFAMRNQNYGGAGPGAGPGPGAGAGCPTSSPSQEKLLSLIQPNPANPLHSGLRGLGQSISPVLHCIVVNLPGGGIDSRFLPISCTK